MPADRPPRPSAEPTTPSREAEIRNTYEHGELLAIDPAVAQTDVRWLLAELRRVRESRETLTEGYATALREANQRVQSLEGALAECIAILDLTSYESETMKIRDRAKQVLAARGGRAEKEGT